MFSAVLHGESRKKEKPLHSWEYLSLEECKNLCQNGSCYAKADDGEIIRMKVTSVHTWKTRPDVRLRVQYGLYQHYEFTFSPEIPNQTFVKEV